MLELWHNLVSSDGFMPHGHCYLWRPGLVWLHVISDALITLAYTSIPFGLVYFVRRRRDVPFHWMFLCFGVFIVACGATHALEIWTLWTPAYWLSGIVKAVTAVASLCTAGLLFKLLPQALAIPSHRQLAKVHADLQRAHDELERRVMERTAELTRRNEELAAQIFERKRIEGVLATSEQRFRRLADAGLIGILTTDGDGSIREANRAFLEMVGYTADEFRAKGLRWADLTPPELRHLDERAIEQLRATGVAAAWEKEYIRKDGSRVPILVGVAMLDGSTGERAAFVLDLSERKRAEAEILRLEAGRAADAKVRALLETAPDAIVVVDEQAQIVFVNAETEALFGYPRQELLGNSVDLLLPERLRPAHARHRTTYFATPIAHRVMGGGRQLVGLRRDGSEFPAEIRLSPLVTETGMLVSSAIRDITERKRAEQALRLAKEAAESANAELETFSYSVAHDLRAPLRGMSGFSAVLLEDYGATLDADAKEYLSRIAGSARRMSEIIDALLSLARLTRMEARRDPVDLNVLGRSVIGQLQANEPDRVVDFVSTEPLVVQGDPLLLRLLLDNLLGNAWKFTARRPQARIELGREEVNGAVAYYVRDNGAGFDMTLVGKLFAPFRRLHAPSEFEGTGIGLATVQRIVHRHGGRVWAEAVQAQGATFHFTLSSTVPGSGGSLDQADT